MAAAVVMVIGCAAPGPAPVVDRQAGPATLPVTAAPVAPPSGPEYYTIKRGDTLSSVARANGLDVRDLLVWNTLDNPNALKVDQVIRIAPPAGVAVITQPLVLGGGVEAGPIGEPAMPVNLPASTIREPRGGKQPYSDDAWARLQRGAEPPSPPVAPPEVVAKADPNAVVPTPKGPPSETAKGESGIDWSWPAHGRVIETYSDSSNKGVDISGNLGEPVYAAAGGKVVYAGSGLRGYGKLVIIKHDGTFLSAYAHNSEILVKEGQSVKRGQKIAELGSTDADTAKLHFEIRRQGKPVDPMQFLPPR